jgi:hypothetical protein
MNHIYLATHMVPLLIQHCSKLPQIYYIILKTFMTKCICNVACVC